MVFLTEVLVFLAAAIIIVPLCRRLGLSSVIGYLLTGVIIGPGALGLIPDAAEVLHFAEIGVVLLLFIIGLELQPRRLWVMRRLVFGLGTAQVVVTTAVISVALYLLFDLQPGVAGLLGFALALSSTAFVLQLLGEQHHLNHEHGRASFGILLFQDVAVIPAIVLLNVLGGADDSALDPLKLAAVLVGLVVARFALRPVLRIVAATGIHELFIASSLALVVGAAVAMYYAGLSMGLGAFIAGMMVADSEYRHQLETDVTPFKGLLLGLFFIAVGMSADLGLLVSSPLLVIGLTLALVVVKALVLWPLARHFVDSPQEALRTAVVMSQGGEFAFVLLTTAVSVNFIDKSMMEIIVLVVTLSMAMTPFLVALLERLLQPDPEQRPFDTPDAQPQTVIIAGFGRFGQIIGRILAMQKIPFTALEINPERVDFVRNYGNKVFYGDATRIDLLNNAHVADARAMVIAMDDIEASVRLASILRETCPRLVLLARARNRQHEIKLRDLGVHVVIRETLLSSLSLTESLLGYLDKSPAEAQRAVEIFREHDQQTLEKQAAVSHDELAFRQTTMDAAEELKLLFADDRS